MARTRGWPHSLTQSQSLAVLVAVLALGALVLLILALVLPDRKAYWMFLLVLSMLFDVGKRLIDPLPHGDQPVVDRDDPHHEGDDHADDDPGKSGGRHGERLLGG